jgi:hypothetical protein
MQRARRGSGSTVYSTRGSLRRQKDRPIQEA